MRSRRRWPTTVWSRLLGPGGVGKTRPGDRGRRPRGRELRRRRLGHRPGGRRVTRTGRGRHRDGAVDRPASGAGRPRGAGRRAGLPAGLPADLRQLRAPGRVVRRPDRAGAALVPGRSCAGDQPAGDRSGRRVRVSSPTAEPRRRRHPVRGSGSTHWHRRDRHAGGNAGRHLRPDRRPAAGDRVGREPAPGARAGRDRGPSSSQAPVSGADRARLSPAAHAAGHGVVELRPPAVRHPGFLCPPRGVRLVVHARRRRGRGCDGGWLRRRRCSRPRHCSHGPLASDPAGHGLDLEIPPARDVAAVRSRAAGRRRRCRRNSAGPRRLPPRARRTRRASALRPGRAAVANPARARGAEPAHRPHMGHRPRPRSGDAAGGGAVAILGRAVGRAARRRLSRASYWPSTTPTSPRTCGRGGSRSPPTWPATRARRARQRHGDGRRFVASANSETSGAWPVR